MKFKIDENLPVEFAHELRAIGHDAVTVFEQRMGGTSDEDLFSVCINEDRILMTLDIDFADIRMYPPSVSPGILVFRIQPQDKNRLLYCLGRIIPLLAKEQLARMLWIVEEDRIRIHEGLLQ
jgi:predicted nuclease of predicted toxin-antitoxin system